MSEPIKQVGETQGDLASSNHGNKEPTAHVEAAEQHPQEVEPTLNPSSSSKGDGGGTNMDQDDEHLDLTQMFAEAGSQLVSASNPKSDAKARFLSCDLVVPGIALKKMAMCVSSSNEKAVSLVAILGTDKCKQYKVEKLSLKGMVIGDFLNDKHALWKSSVKHLHDRRVGAVMVFSSFGGTIEQVSQL